MKSCLIVVDFQNDFVCGSLGFPAARELDGRICEKIAAARAEGGEVVFTLDTHFADYLETQEGRRLPVEHCIKGTEGHLIYGQTAKAARRGKLYKEQPFVLGVDASEIYPEDCSGETILVQGIIDVFFEEEDGLVVLDYKTDKVKNAGELKEKYHAQLDYYAQALEQLLEKPVKEKIIYSFTLREEIEV